MKRPAWLPNTLAWQFAATTVVAMFATLLLVGSFLTFGGVWAQPPAMQMSMLGWVNATYTILDAAPSDLRPSLAAAATTDVTNDLAVDWYPASSSVSMALEKEIKTSPAPSLGPNWLGPMPRAMVLFTPDRQFAPPPGLRQDAAKYLLGIRLGDKSWIVFIALQRVWGLTVLERWALGFVFFILSIAGVSALAGRQLSRPIMRLAGAVQRFGLDPHAAPMPETGPRELRQVIATFNAMQAQIRRLISYRTTMLAAMSHDLRTPLTRIRLRGEFIDSEEQRQKLFRDIDEMAAMVEGALAFFRDDAAVEAATAFDLTGLLQTIANDYADQGIDIPVTPAKRVICRGRPFTLKRAFTNLIENAVKYGTPPEITLCPGTETVVVSILDRGPGLPLGTLEDVFNPYYRIETSRNRATGGVGLGLTAARSIIREHGGDIVLENRAGGGLEARVTLPMIMKGALSPTPSRELQSRD